MATDTGIILRPEGIKKLEARELCFWKPEFLKQTKEVSVFNSPMVCFNRVTYNLKDSAFLLNNNAFDRLLNQTFPICREKTCCIYVSFCKIHSLQDC